MSEIVGYLITSKETGEKRIQFKPLADLPFNRERYTWEPIGFMSQSNDRFSSAELLTIADALDTHHRAQIDGSRTCSALNEKDGFDRFVSKASETHDVRTKVRALINQGQTA